jgi:hypothetical protein
VQFSDVEDGVGRSVFGVSNETPRWAAQQFGHPCVDDSIGDIGGSHGLEAEFNRQ